MRMSLDIKMTNAPSKKIGDHHLIGLPKKIFPDIGERQTVPVIAGKEGGIFHVKPWVSENWPTSHKIGNEQEKAARKEPGPIY
jgi:hypothetical protein